MGINRLHRLGQSRGIRVPLWRRPPSRRPSKGLTGKQAELFPSWRYHAFITYGVGSAVLNANHRHHAVAWSSRVLCLWCIQGRSSGTYPHLGKRAGAIWNQGQCAGTRGNHRHDERTAPRRSPSDCRPRSSDRRRSCKCGTVLGLRPVEYGYRPGHPRNRSAAWIGRIHYSSFAPQRWSGLCLFYLDLHPSPSDLFAAIQHWPEATQSRTERDDAKSDHGEDF